MPLLCSRSAVWGGGNSDAAELPVAALITGPDGQFTYGVGKDNKVRRLPLTLLAAVMGLALGTVLAMMRLSRFRILSVPAGIYVNVMRSVPLLLVIFWLISRLMFWLVS